VIPRNIGAGMVAIYDIHGSPPLQTACSSTGEFRLNHIDEGGVSSRGVWIVTVQGMLDRYADDQLTNPTPADYEMCDLAG
jgi:hypothetical protein